MQELIGHGAQVHEELLLDRENSGSVEDRIEVITRRGEYAQDLATLQRRRDAAAKAGQQGD